MDGDDCLQGIFNNSKTAKMIIALMKKKKVIGVQISNFKREENAIITNDYSKVTFQMTVSNNIKYCCYKYIYIYC